MPLQYNPQQHISPAHFNPYKNTFEDSGYINEKKDIPNTLNLPNCYDELALSSLMGEDAEGYSTCASMDCEQCGFGQDGEATSLSTNGSVGSYYCTEYPVKGET